ncbi:hypothetical protein ACM40_15345 [Chryseobacterium sp. BLS98]|uniref:hypothetical protein n=1 Tax=Chryseobacterium sp. BLS98 TaxID=885586 RepID=UPI00065AE8F7|nr:hypothetical protein [Chryseobacterium sp. BLS98]KMQ61075.1 hypothetical protein ACM40_15345 [Chryseobacterium sp. BLS98]
MLHDERILKNKFAYFFTIVFLLGWIIYYGVFVINVLLKGYRLVEKYIKFRIPIYFLNFIAFILLILTFVHVFKESRKMFKYLNSTCITIIILASVSFYINYDGKWGAYIYSFLFGLTLFLIGPVLLINYFKHIPAKSEIENIGKHND